jgi:hypothetical protein
VGKLSPSKSYEDDAKTLGLVAVGDRAFSLAVTSGPTVVMVFHRLSQPVCLHGVSNS